jgi:hypothetical protein
MKLSFLNPHFTTQWNLLLLLRRRRRRPDSQGPETVTKSLPCRFQHRFQELVCGRDKRWDASKLRFEVGDRVLCRMGPNTEQDWSQGNDYFSYGIVKRNI